MYYLFCLWPAVPEEQRETFEAVRVAAAALLARLAAHPLHGARISLILRCRTCHSPCPACYLPACGIACPQRWQ
jgi:hypothetical protein